MNVRRSLALVVTIILAACSAGPTASTGNSQSASAASSTSPSAPASSAPSGEPETTAFTIGTSGLGINHLPYLIAADRLREDDGWDIFIVDLASGDLVVQGVASGEVDLGTGQMPAVLLAQEQGVPLTMIAEFARNTWTSYAKTEFASCEGLNGIAYAVHSLSSFTYLYPKAWIEQTCPGTTPEWIILPGSENRLAAMLTGEIDATTMELADAVSLEAQNQDGKWANVVNFATALDVITGTYWGNSDFIRSNPNTITKFLATVLEEMRHLMGDQAYFEQQLEKYLPEYTEAGVADDIAALYIDLDIFPADGGMTVDSMESSLSFLKTNEIIKGSVAVDAVMDRSYLEAAIDSLGD